MYILMAGLSHKTAPIEIREHFAMSGANLDGAYKALTKYPQIEGAVILDTCNRMEIYVTTKDVEIGTAILEDFLVNYAKLNYKFIKKYIYQPSCYDTIHHLFNVTSGLDSMILGETQIIGQVKDAYIYAMENGYSDGVLNSLFQRALNVGKKVRTETGIDTHPVSVSYVAVELARNILGSLEDKTVMVVGAGEMSELTTKYLMLSGVSSVIVSNRSYEKATLMAQKFNGRAVKFDDLAVELLTTDIVISCTAASHYVIREDNCKSILEKRGGRQIIFIDIAVPRDIDPVLQNVEGVYIYDIDDLKNVIDSNFDERQKAADLANQIIDVEIEKFNEWLACLYVVPVISAIKQKGEAIKQQELKRAFNRLGELSEHEVKVISSMANSIVNQMLRTPVMTLKDKATSNQAHLYAEVLKTLFALEVEGTDEKVKTGN